MKAKTTRIISMVLMIIPGLVLIAGGSMKLAHAEPEPVMQFLNKAGFGGCITVLGLTELIIAALFLYPKTNKIGFLLLSCYFSGAFSLELSAGAPPASVIFIALAWVSMFLKDKDMFLSVPAAGKNV